MIVAIVIVVFLLALFFSLWRVIRSHGVRHSDIRCLSPKESEIDVEVLTLLLSREENEYLRKSLPDHDFCAIKRRRLSLARKYLKAINTNTRELIRAAEAARSSSDAEVVVPPKLSCYRDMVQRIVFILQRLHATQSSTSSAG